MKMAANNDGQTFSVLCGILNLVLTTISVALHLNFVSLLQILLQHQALKRASENDVDHRPWFG